MPASEAVRPHPLPLPSCPARSSPLAPLSLRPPRRLRYHCSPHLRPHPLLLLCLRAGRLRARGRGAQPLSLQSAQHAGLVGAVPYRTVPCCAMRVSSCSAADLPMLETHSKGGGCVQLHTHLHAGLAGARRPLHFLTRRLLGCHHWLVAQSPVVHPQTLQRRHWQCIGVCSAGGGAHAASAGVACMARQSTRTPPHLDRRPPRQGHAFPPAWCAQLLPAMRRDKKGFKTTGY